MTPVTQEFRHDPKNFIWGDCHRAALATILDLPISKVPHFFYQCPEVHHPDKVWREMEEWLQPLGFT